MSQELLNKTKNKKRRRIVIAVVIVLLAICGCAGMLMKGGGDSAGTVTISIDCSDLSGQMQRLERPELKDSIPADGQILPEGYPGAEGEKADGYMVAIMENGGQQVVLAKPDETLNVAGVYYTFRAPMAYPGLRFKTIPSFALPFLYLSFALLVIGLYLCFFHAPAAAVVRGEHIAIKEARDSEMLIRTLQEAAGSSSGR